MKRNVKTPSLALIVQCKLFGCFWIALLANFTFLIDDRGSISSPASPEELKYWHPAFDPVSARPGMPQVLLIGDSISIEYTLHVRGLLARVADVHRPPVNCESTVLGLKEIERWLGDRKWDVIHFNWGLHDLKLVKPDGEGENRLQGKQAVTLEEYDKNLRALVSRLQKTGAKLIWATTTPVPKGTSNRLNGDEAAYNAVARKIMFERGIGIDDLHGFVLPRMQEIQLPANVHFTPEGSLQLAREVARHILAALKPAQVVP
jgi:acyl-CoA thioesterase-1